MRRGKHINSSKSSNLDFSRDWFLVLAVISVGPLGLSCRPSLGHTLMSLGHRPCLGHPSLSCRASSCQSCWLALSYIACPGPHYFSKFLELCITSIRCTNGDGGGRGGSESPSMGSKWAQSRSQDSCPELRVGPRNLTHNWRVSRSQNSCSELSQS